MESNAYTCSLEALETIPKVYGLFEHQKPLAVTYLGNGTVVKVEYESGIMCYDATKVWYKSVFIGDTYFNATKNQVHSGNRILITFTQEQIDWLWEDYRNGNH